MSLYRNYRPKDFPSLVGQDHIKITLLNAIQSGQIAHAYLFTGPRGTGKTTTARLMAKAINAEMTADGRFDGSEIAEEIDSGRLIDVIEIDAASNRGIDEIRDLREKINYSPTRAKNKVYIIDEVHMLTKEAFNALLKTLEEPPSFVYFILATTEIHKVPETIISRCQRFDFRRINEKDLYDRLSYVCQVEGFIAEDEALKIIARQSRGGLRDALSMLEQLVSGKKLDLENVKKVLGISNFGAVESIYKMLKEGQAADAMAEITKIFAAGVDLVQFNKELLDYLRIEMLEKVRSGDEDAARWIIELIGNFQEAYEKQKYSYIPELPLEVAIVKSALNGSKKKPELKNIEVKTEEKATVKEIVVEMPEVEKPAMVEEIVPRVEAVLPVSAIGGEKSAGAISLEELKKRWSKIFDRIDNALAKRCLMAAQVLQLTDSTLTLGFSNNFNKDKLFVPELLAICEEAIYQEFKIRVALKGIVDVSLAHVGKMAGSVNMAWTAAQLNSGTSRTPAMRNEGHAGIENRPVETTPAPVDQTVLNSALNIFGGQVVG